MAHHRWPFVIQSLIFLLSQCLLVIATCYVPDQNHTAEPAIYTPCNQNTPFSMCIRSQIDPGGYPADTCCLPNGLVLNPEGGGQFWRHGCTDRTWESDYCLKAFNACPMVSYGDVQVTPCSGNGNSTTWCCGGGNTACCGEVGAITIAATIGPSSTSSSTISSTTFSSSTVVPTTSSTASSSMNPTSTSDGKALSVGAEAGIGVGVSLAGIASLGGIIWFVLRRMQRRGRGHVDNDNYNYFLKPELDGNSSGGRGGREMADLDEPPIQELD